MSAFIRLSFICIPGATVAALTWALMFGIVAPAWLINMSALAGLMLAGVLSVYRYKRR